MALEDKLKKYTPSSGLLQDRVILVSGAGEGIGRTVSLALAAHGAKVILLGRTLSKLESLYDEIVDAKLPEPGIYPLDLVVANLENYAELASIVLEKYGRLDGLLHNAGILGDRTPLQFYDPESFARVMQVNFNAALFMTQALLPLLQQSPDASIVLTTSGVGLKPRAYWGAYALSKYATEGLAYLLADELENTTNIRVNLINPGATRTKMRAAANPGEDPSTLKTPEDIVNTYLFLLGPDSKGVNGERINAQ